MSDDDVGGGGGDARRRVVAAWEMLAYLNIFRNSIQNKVAGERVHFSNF